MPAGLRLKRWLKRFCSPINDGKTGAALSSKAAPAKPRQRALSVANVMAADVANLYTASLYSITP
jgi:hypothetical protein